MKVLFLNGSRPGEDKINRMFDSVMDQIRSNGFDYKSYILNKEKINFCNGCFGCWVKTPGVCAINDSGREIARDFIQSDIVIFITPITFGGYSSELKKALDRLIPNILPFFMKVDGEIHHKPRYKKYPSIIAIGVLVSPDEASENIFKKLVSRNIINFHSPSYAVGILTADTDPQTVKKESQRLLSDIGVRS